VVPSNLSASRSSLWAEESWHAILCILDRGGRYQGCEAVRQLGRVVANAGI